MEKNYKPDNYNDLSPYFVVKRANHFIDFIRTVFEAKELRRFEKPDGSILHAEFLISDTVVMLGEQPEEYEPTKMLIHVFVENVYHTYNNALQYGCISVETPNQKDGDPDIRGAFRDPADNIWYIASQI